MYRISDLGAAVARLENLDPDASKRREKEMRNLSQRLALRPAGRDGRADTYDMDNMATLRIVQVASDLGFTRPVLAEVVRSLLDVDRADGPKTGNQSLVIARLLKRAKTEQSVPLFFDVYPGGHVVFWMGNRADPLTNSIFASAGHPDPIATATLDVRDVLKSLMEALRPS